MISSIIRSRREWMIRHNSYAFTPYKYFDYSKLSKICYLQRTGRCKERVTYNDCIIMADTETSKEKAGTICRNYVVAWTISIRAFDMNIVTLYGHKPSEMVECIEMMQKAMEGEKTVIYFHHLNYDWTFLRKHFIKAWGNPEHQLNTKSYNPIFITFKTGLILRDSLILSQRSLEKWAKDLDVEHQKAVGAWDYEKVRNQSDRLSPMEKTYIENDTLCGVECLQKTMDELGKRIFSMPYTATGIVRSIVQRIGKENRAREKFKAIVPSFDVQKILEEVAHGGYVHNNRYMSEMVVEGDIDEYDGLSWYPAMAILFKFPGERFSEFGRVCDPHFILANSDEYAYIFKLIMMKPRLKNNEIVMPVISKSKLDSSINVIEDAGRVLEAEYVSIYTNDVDLELIMEQYDYDKACCCEVYYSKKEYLPRWFTDYVYKCFEDKQKLKGGDPVAYSIAKGKLNAIAYGLMMQRPVKISIEENYDTGEFDEVDNADEKKLYDIYKNKRSSILPYQWGVYIPSYGQRELFKIGKLTKVWLYSDTDSVFGKGFDKEKIDTFNEDVKKRLLERGYGPVHHNGVNYWLGTVKLEGQYKEFVSVGAKRYATRDQSGLAQITCAGVSKSGVNCLKNDLRNFHAGFVFDGKTSGKKRHTYFIENDIWVDKNGNERGDSIDLSPEDYVLDSNRFPDEEKALIEEVSIQVYETS